MMEPINGLEPLEKDDTVREALAESIQVLVSTLSHPMRAPLGQRPLLFLFCMGAARTA